LTDQNVTSGTAPALHVTYDPGTNRQTGECADANGNLCGSYYSYDVENRFVRKGASFSVTPDVAYSYRPGNKRVWKGANYVVNQNNWSLPSTDEVTFWSITGQKLATYNLSQYQPGGYYTQPQLVATQTGANYYFGGKLVKNSTGYVTPDRLGSIGKYFPYGRERPSATTDGKEKFATYFRDSETGLDYANNRYHQPGMGRFMTADRSPSSNANVLPGNWNRYAYVGGDPINKTDPRGLCSPEDDPPCYSTEGTASSYDDPGQTPFNPGNDIPSTWWEANCTEFGQNCAFAPDPGGGGDPPPPAPRPECDRSNPLNAQKLDWIDAHRSDADKIANELGVTTADILGLSAIESGWGGGPFVKDGRNNFFSQHAPAPDSNGTVPIGGNGRRYGYMATFDSYAASAQSFADQYGYIVKNITDPAAFAAALQNARKYGINFNGTKVANFVSSTQNTINGIASRMDCP
jgi:RHS repeat-associated protein